MGESKFSLYFYFFSSYCEIKLHTSPSYMISGWIWAPAPSTVLFAFTKTLQSLQVFLNLEVQEY